MKDWFICIPDLNGSAVVLSKRLYLYKTIKSVFYTMTRPADGKDKYRSTYFIRLFNILAFSPIGDSQPPKHVTDGQTDNLLDRPPNQR